MLATYRCGEIKEQALALYEKDFLSFHKQANKGLMSNFKQFCLELEEKVLSAYDETAKNYFEKVYKDVRESLIHSILQQFYVGFTNQGKMFIPLSQKHLKNEIEKELTMNENFSEVVGRLRNKHIEHFVNYMKGIQLTEQWDLNMNSVVEIFDDVIGNFRKTKLDNKRKDQTVYIVLK